MSQIAHQTIDACATSQFEQLREITAFPLGSTKLIQPVVMLNLLGYLASSNRSSRLDTDLQDSWCKTSSLW